MNNLYTGFTITINGLEIQKDPQSSLIYTFDWSEWLDEGDTIDNVNYVVTTRSNDPNPLLKLSEGIDTAGRTYVELSAGQNNKTYTVTANIVTTNGLVDSRFFRVKVQPRSA